MPRMRPTAQNMPDALYVHHPPAAVVKRYPNNESMGTRIPIIAVNTRGRKQYPRTLAERGKVSVALKWPGWPPAPDAEDEVDGGFMCGS